MASFVCRVGTAEGTVAVRTLDAPDEESARADVARQGGKLFSIRRQEGNGGARGGRAPAAAARRGGLPGWLQRLTPGGRGVRPDDFLIFNQELAALLRAGLPIVSGFEILLERQQNPRFQEILRDVRSQLVSGVALSDAFLSHGDVFPRLYASSLKAGERSGEVEKVIRRYLGYQRILGAVRRKVTGALVYPSVLIALSIGLIFILLTYVIPRFTEFYAGFQTELPALTVAVVGLATFMKRHAPEILLSAAVAVVLFRRWKATPSGRRTWDGLLLKAPFVGKILHQFALSQFSRSLATLVGAGTPLVSSLEIAAGAVANQKVSDAVASVVPKVREGAELWRSLEETGQFTSLTVEMVKVGESTGALEEMLTTVSEFYDESIETSLQTLINLIEPMILIVMGGVIATILLSVYLPMFTILQNIKG